MGMKVRPGTVYRNLVFVLGGALLFYVVYSIIAFDDGLHIPIHRRQKHLYLTVSKDRIGHRFEKLAPKRILMWTKVFDIYPTTDYLSDCKGYSDRCIIDSNRSILPVADAIVFHARDINGQALPNSTERKPSQRYVFMSMEAPPNSGRSKIPKNFFNWTATYLFQSDVLFKYGVFWLSAKDAELRGFKFQDYHIDQARLIKRKSGIFGLISNCETISKREVALQELGKYINITIAGKCATIPENINLCPWGKSCDDIISEYPFYIAIENTVCRDYITEKYWARIHIPSIPIVMKREIYKASNVPPNSFIAMDDFKNPKEMANYLNSLESDSAKYASYFTWRNGLWTAAPWNAPGYRNKYCRLCERLWEEEKKESVIEDVWNWFDSESMCETDEFVKKWIKF